MTQALSAQPDARLTQVLKYLEISPSSWYRRCRCSSERARPGPKPRPIADEVVEIIRSRMDEGGRVKIGLDVKAGEKVRIKSSPLKDCIGIFDGSVSPRGRVRILLQLVGSQVSVYLPESLVERIR